MNNYHWDRFYLHLYYQVRPEVLYRAWATPDGLASFFVSDCIGLRDGEKIDSNSFFAVGDRFEFLWDDSSNTAGEFLEVNKEQFETVFSFGKNSKIRIRIKKDDKGSLLELKHFNIVGTPEEQHRFQLDCRVGWTYYMTNLRSVLESNIDLRDKNPDCAGTLSWGTYTPENIILD